MVRSWNSFMLATVDFLGVNYSALRVMAPRFSKASDSPLCQSIYEPYVMPGRKSIPTVAGKYTSSDLSDIAQNIKENYGNIEWMLTEMEWELKMKKDS